MKRTYNAFWSLIIGSLGLTFVFASVALSLIWYQLDDSQAELLRGIAYDNAYYLLAIITMVPVALWVIFEFCYTRFYLPLKRIPSEISLIYKSNPAHRLDLSDIRDIRELTEAINDFAKRYEYLTEHIAEEIEHGRSDTEKERNLLAAIMAELPLGLIICNASGRILLFNSQAKSQFAGDPSRNRSENFIGLGRSIFHLIDRSLINHALDEINERLNTRRKRIASYFITHAGATTLLLVETIPVLNQEQLVSGFILSIQDISGTVERYETINTHLQTLHSQVSARLDELMLLLRNHTGIDEATRVMIDREIGIITERCSDTRHAVLDAAFETMPLSRLELGPLLFMIQQQTGSLHDIRVNVATPLPATRILGDTCSLVAAFVFIIESLARETGCNEFDLAVVSTMEPAVHFSISWAGHPLKTAIIDELTSRRVPLLTKLDYVLKQNRIVASMNPAGDGRSLVLTGHAERSEQAPGSRRSPVVAGARPAFYDFTLFEVDEENQDLLNRPLNTLTYSVIDTETTGLDPEGGDEIIAIGAVRIVRSRLLQDDRFDELVNPGRTIPYDSYRIHGIDKDMLAGKPPIESILPAFARYVSDTVIVGHDVAFDMKMLKIKEPLCGVSFNNLILDTLLLSAILHPVHKQHDLDSIARRLGVTIIGRHSAIGDAVATAEIFLKLIPILQIKGIETLNDAIQAAKRAYLRRLRY